MTPTFSSNPTLDLALTATSTPTADAELGLRGCVQLLMGAPHSNDEAMQLRKQGVKPDAYGRAPVMRRNRRNVCSTQKRSCTRILSKTHTYARVRARARTHTHTHTNVGR